jgi:hypothetical protein
LRRRRVHPAGNRPDRQSGAEFPSLDVAVPRPDADDQHDPGAHADTHAHYCPDADADADPETDADTDADADPDADSDFNIYAEFNDDGQRRIR